MTELERKQDRAPVPAGWDYATAPESREIVVLRERYGHFVGGEWLEPAETYTTIDPASEEPLAEVGQATEQEVEARGWQQFVTRGEKRDMVEGAPMLSQIGTYTSLGYFVPTSFFPQLFAALKYLGREVLFVRFEGQSHGLSRGGHPQLRLKRLHLILDWFEKYLK